MKFLYFLEGLRTPWLDSLMQLLTELGSETLFLAAVLVLFWCVSKRKAYLLMAVGFLGTLANQFLKLCCQVPRPWVRDPGFTIVESARAGATGYSFPSGHSQNAVGTFATLAACTENRFRKILCIAVCILVPFSRMYLGVHTPADVLVGSGMALCCLAVFVPLFREDRQDRTPQILGVLAVLGVAFVLYAQLWPFPADIDAGNLSSAVKNSYTLLGALLGMIVVWYADRSWLNFPTDAVWYAQIFKFLGGLVLVLVVKSALKAPLEAILPAAPARMVRYFLVVLTAGIAWPLTFPWFARMGRH